MPRAGQHIYIFFLGKTQSDCEKLGTAIDWRVAIYIYFLSEKNMFFRCCTTWQSIKEILIQLDWFIIYLLVLIAKKNVEIESLVLRMELL